MVNCKIFSFHSKSISPIPNSDNYLWLPSPVLLYISSPVATYTILYCILLVKFLLTEYNFYQSTLTISLPLNYQSLAWIVQSFFCSGGDK